MSKSNLPIEAQKAKSRAETLENTKIPQYILGWVFESPEDLFFGTMGYGVFSVGWCLVMYALGFVPVLSTIASILLWLPITLPISLAVLIVAYLVLLPVNHYLSKGNPLTEDFPHKEDVVRMIGTGDILGERLYKARIQSPDAYEKLAKHIILTHNEASALDFPYRGDVNHALATLADSLPKSDAGVKRVHDNLNDLRAIISKRVRELEVIRKKEQQVLNSGEENSIDALFSDLKNNLLEDTP